MSQAAPLDKRKQVETSTDALNAFNFEVLADVFHPELEHHSVFAAVEGEVYRGIEGQRRRWENVHATWDGFRIAVVKVHDVDDESVVVVLHLTGNAKVSGAPSTAFWARCGRGGTGRSGGSSPTQTHAGPRSRGAVGVAASLP